VNARQALDGLNASAKVGVPASEFQEALNNASGLDFAEVPMRDAHQVVVLSKKNIDDIKLALLARAGEYDLTSNDDGVDRMLRLFSLLSVFSGNVTIENFRPVDAERQPS
jgi:hypothetical protein